MTLADILWIMAPLVKALGPYHAFHHVMAELISNIFSETVAGTEAHVEELRRAMHEMMSMIAQHHADPKHSLFRMRMEVRFLGVGLDEALEDEPPWDGQSRADAKTELMMHVTAALYFYQLNIFAVDVMHVPSISPIELMLPPALHVMQIEVTLAIVRLNFREGRKVELRYLPLDAHLRLVNHLARARAARCVRPDGGRHHRGHRAPRLARARRERAQAVRRLAAR